MIQKTILFLMLCCCFVGCQSDEIGLQEVDSDVTATAELPVFSLAWSEYPSWSAFGVAHELDILNGEEGELSDLEKKYGVDVVLKEKDYDTCIQYYNTGVTDASCLTNMDILAPSIGRPAVCVLPTSTSNGADAIVSVESSEITDLKGKKVYGLDQSVSEYVFIRLVEEAGEDLADYEFVGLDPSTAAQSFQTDSPDVKDICVWNPFKMSSLEKRDGSKVVGDTSTIPGEVIDAVFMGQDSASKPGADKFSLCIAEAFYQVCDLLNDPATREKTLVQLGAKFSDLDAKKMEVCATETSFYDTPSKALALMTGEDLPETMSKVSKFCVGKGMCESPPSISYGSDAGDVRFDPAFVKTLSEE